MDENNSTEATNSVDTTNDTSDFDAALVADDDIDAKPEQPKEETPASESEEESDEEEAESESEEQSEDEVEEDSKEDESTDDPKELARQAYKKREEARQARAAEQSKQKEDLDKFVNEASDEQERAFRQLQVDVYTNRVQGNNDRLVNGYEKAINTIPEFQNPTPAAKKFLDASIDEFQARHVVIDNNGNPYDVNGDINQFLQEKADTLRELTQIGARQQSQAKAKTKSNAVTTPARSKPAPKTDPVLAELLKDD